MDSEFIKEVIVPIISVLTFFFSISVLFIESYTKRRRLIVSNTIRLAKFNELKFQHNNASKDQVGIIASFNIINPSPHDIGVSNFNYLNDGNTVYIEVNPRFQKVFLDNILETFPTINTDIIIKSNSQQRVNFLFLENELQSLSFETLEVKFSAIFNDWSFPFKHPIKFLKIRKIPFKVYKYQDKIKGTVKDEFKHLINKKP